MSYLKIIFVVYTTSIKQPSFENFSKFFPVVHMRISSPDSDLGSKLLSSYMFFKMLAIVMFIL